MFNRYIHVQCYMQRVFVPVRNTCWRPRWYPGASGWRQRSASLSVCWTHAAHAHQNLSVKKCKKLKFTRNGNHTKTILKKHSFSYVHVYLNVPAGCSYLLSWVKISIFFFTSFALTTCKCTWMCKTMKATNDYLLICLPFGLLGWSQFSGIFWILK